LRSLGKQSGNINQFTFSTSQTVRIHFHSSRNENTFTGFTVSFQTGEYQAYQTFPLDVIFVAFWTVEAMIINKTI